MSIIFNNVSHTYNRGTTFAKKALDNVSLKIEQGEILGIVGRTGSGKSTLLQHINGLLVPDKGEVYFEGKDINDEDYSKKKLRSKVAMVFQNPDYQLFETSVIEDVKFGPKNIGMDKLDVDLNSYNALKMVGIGEEYIDASPMELSVGQKKRVCIAGALAMKPRVLILDEPFLGLDAKGKMDLYEILYNLHEEEDITLIVVSHDMEAVADITRRVVVMDEGRIIYDETPEELFYHYDDLHKLGLCAPDVVYIMDELKRRGMRLMGRSPVNIYEAAECIVDYVSRR